MKNAISLQAAACVAVLGLGWGCQSSRTPLIVDMTPATPVTVTPVAQVQVVPPQRQVGVQLPPPPVAAPVAQAPAAPPPPPAPAKLLQARTVALLVQSRDPGLHFPKAALSDALASKLSGRGFKVVNPYNASGEMPSQVSALELARTSRTEGVITASVLDFHDVAIGTPPRAHRSTVRMSFNLVDTWSGTTVCGETFKMESPIYTSNQVTQNRQEYLSDLFYAAAEKCAEKLAANPAVRTWKPTPPPPPPPPLPPPPPPETILNRKVDALVQQMLSNPQFVANYGKIKAKPRKRLPIAVIGGVDNLSGDAKLDVLVKAAGEHFRVKLFNSKLFDVKDDGVLVALSKRVIANGNSPLEDHALMQELETHGSPDFFVQGDLKLVTDLDGRSYYSFRLAIHSLRTGKVLWEGIETIDMKKEGAK